MVLDVPKQEESTVQVSRARRGMGRSRRAFIGSTAEDVLEKLPCDALIVKTPDFAAELPF